MSAARFRRHEPQNVTVTNRPTARAPSFLLESAGPPMRSNESSNRRRHPGLTCLALSCTSHLHQTVPKIVELNLVWLTRSARIEPSLVVAPRTREFMEMQTLGRPAIFSHAIEVNYKAGSTVDRKSIALPAFRRRKHLRIEQAPSTVKRLDPDGISAAMFARRNCRRLV
jgi:hypothetical protein